ncbi:MAG: CpXC domain-containing protein [Treponema sp.]|nr:CpXC domain-containing protein [Treponema sp.]MCL2236990.1 CpXC domain-containing protein [Treponema sp.]
MKTNINCLCGTNVSVEYKEEIDLDSHPEILEKIFMGNFMSYKCSFCGKQHKPEYKIKIIWNSKNLNMEVLPELDRGEFYRNKKENPSVETVIGYPEMADRLAIINDNLEPVIIETLKSFLLDKAIENYPDKEINIWYNNKNANGIEFHLDGIRNDEVAVMRVPMEMYEKSLEDFRKRPKNDIYASLRVRSYLSVQNILRHDALK